MSHKHKQLIPKTSQIHTMMSRRGFGSFYYICLHAGGKDAEKQEKKMESFLESLVLSIQIVYY